MNEPNPPPAVPATPATLENVVEALTRLTTVVEVHGKALVQLNDIIGKVARYSGMQVLNGRDKMDG